MPAPGVRVRSTNPGARGPSRRDSLRRRVDDGPPHFCDRSAADRELAAYHVLPSVDERALRSTGRRAARRRGETLTAKSSARARTFIRLHARALNFSARRISSLTSLSSSDGVDASESSRRARCAPHPTPEDAPTHPRLPRSAAPRRRREHAERPGIRTGQRLRDRRDVGRDRGLRRLPPRSIILPASPGMRQASSTRVLQGADDIRDPSGVPLYALTA